MPPPVPARPAAYIRVARADSADDLTVQMQQETVLRAAAERGWPQPTVYTDIGEPASQRPGPALTRLTGAITSGQHDAVITHDAARISRNPAHVEAFISHCTSHSTAVEFIHGGSLDPETLHLHTGITS